MRIGIITLYYKSINYGANLQAYALCKFLNNNGYDAEQICFKTGTSKKESFFDRLKRIFSFGLGYMLSSLKGKLKAFKMKTKPSNDGISEDQRRQFKETIKTRQSAFEKFNQEIIPHSKTVYYADTIAQSVSNYDAFITGSDQVWNFRSYNPIYFLDFAPESKIKLSYAASFSMDRLERWQEKIVKKSLRTYKAVSVREQSSLKFIDCVDNVKEAVLDPTFLLDIQDWSAVCSPRCINDKYVFCYFLGDNKKERELAEKFAKRNDLIIVTIPHAGGGMRIDDFSFGDIKMPAATPEQFLSLIKYADYVFTDSFHAVVFSNLFKKQYVVFDRNAKKQMTSRIKDLTALYGTENRYCSENEKLSIEYILNLQTIDYNEISEQIEYLKCKSKRFLLSNLGV